jgi:prepilin-type N-terminal cleavage/methylation domain-containing protein
MKYPFQNKRAFTLIELLTVIAIIIILTALLFPAIKNALLKSEVAQAQSGISNLSTALRAYYTEYGKWPISDTAGTWNYVVDANMVSLLSGTDIGTLTSPGPTTELDGVLGGSSGQFQGNPRKIPFLQFKQSDLGTFTTCQDCYLDPWKKPYYLKLDVTYANTIPNPFDNTVPAITNGFLVWSDGPDGQESHTAGDGVGVNKDNVKSW